MISVPDSFHTHAAGQVIVPRTGLRISFTRESSDDVGYFTLDKSVLDGPDLLAPNWDNPIQSWDAYKYADFTDRLVSMEYSRSIEFPYGVQTALADISLDNTDGYFTPGSGSAISGYNFPKRPLRLLAGFEGEGLLPQFVGLTQEMPVIDDNAKVAKYHAADFLSEIAAMNLTNIIVGQDLRTDQVLKLILDQFGVRESQEAFEQGANVIPFVFFDIGESAGEAIRKLIQAEGGRLWLDEEGMLRFQARASHMEEPIFNFGAYQVIKMAPSSDSRIVNHIVIDANVREVQEWQTVYTKASSSTTVNDSLWVIPSGGSITRELSLSDPCLAVEPLEQGKNAGVSWFSTRTSGGTEVSTGVTASGVLTSTSYKVTFTNNYSEALEVDEISLWGEPAKVVDHIKHDSRDLDSEKKYGEQLMEIRDNQFFQSVHQAHAFSQWLLLQHGDYGATFDVEVKGDFALQLGDMVQFDSTTDFPGAYVIEAISYVLGVGSMTTKLKVHPYRTAGPGPFILDQSQLVATHSDSGDYLG